MIQNVDGESTSLKLEQKEVPWLEEPSSVKVGKLLLSAANHCRTAALRHNRETANLFAVTRVVPRIEAFVPFLGMRAFSIVQQLEQLSSCFSGIQASWLSNQILFNIFCLCFSIIRRNYS